jgi:hypothetical protein
MDVLLVWLLVHQSWIHELTNMEVVQLVVLKNDHGLH